MKRCRLQPAAECALRTGDGLLPQIRSAERGPDSKAEEKRGLYFGGEFQFDPWSKAQGWLTAFDAATGTQRWRYQSSKPMIGGVAATGGDLVFIGEITGDFLAVDANDGKVLYKHDVGGPVAGGVVSYAAGGKQHHPAARGRHVLQTHQ